MANMIQKNTLLFSLLLNLIWFKSVTGQGATSPRNHIPVDSTYDYLTFYSNNISKEVCSIGDFDKPEKSKNPDKRHRYVNDMKAGDEFDKAGKDKKKLKILEREGKLDFQKAGKLQTIKDVRDNSSSDQCKQDLRDKDEFKTALFDKNSNKCYLLENDSILKEIHKHHDWKLPTESANFTSNVNAISFIKFQNVAKANVIADLEEQLRAKTDAISLQEDSREIIDNNTNSKTYEYYLFEHVSNSGYESVYNIRKNKFISTMWRKDTLEMKHEYNDKFTGGNQFSAFIFESKKINDKKNLILYINAHVPHYSHFTTKALNEKFTKNALERGFKQNAGWWDANIKDKLASIAIMGDFNRVIFDSEDEIPNGLKTVTDSKGTVTPHYGLPFLLDIAGKRMKNGVPGKRGTTLKTFVSFHNGNPEALWKKWDKMTKKHKDILEPHGTDHIMTWVIDENENRSDSEYRALRPSDKPVASDHLPVYSRFKILNPNEDLKAILDGDNSNSSSSGTCTTVIIVIIIIVVVALIAVIVVYCVLKSRKNNEIKIQSGSATISESEADVETDADNVNYESEDSDVNTNRLLGPSSRSTEIHQIESAPGTLKTVTQIDASNNNRYEAVGIDVNLGPDSVTVNDNTAVKEFEENEIVQVEVQQNQTSSDDHDNADIVKDTIIDVNELDESNDAEQ